MKELFFLLSFFFLIENISSQIIENGSIVDSVNQNDLNKKRFIYEDKHEFSNGSKIRIRDCNDFEIKSLVVLGQVWGFLKYYHPKIATGEYNWDYELFRIMPKIIEADNLHERNNSLFEWIESFGSVSVSGEKENSKIVSIYKEKENVKIIPDLSWIDSSALGARLTLMLNKIKNTKRAPENYYVKLTPEEGNPEFKNEAPYHEINYSDVGFRLLCLYRYWNIIQYYFPYKNLIDEDWKDVLNEYVPKFLIVSSELEYQKNILSLIAKIHDTHANIWSQNYILEHYKGLYYVPIEITFIEGKAVVTGYNIEPLSKGSGLVLNIGSVIETINSKPIAEIIKEKLPYTPASNYPTQLREIAKELLRTNDSVLKITYRENGIKYTKKIKCIRYNQMHICVNNVKSDTCFKIIDSSISYIYPGSLKNEYLINIMPEVLKTRGLIIDFRCYPSDFSVFALSNYLLPQAIDFVKFTNASITFPGFFTYTPTLKVGYDNKEYYKGKVVIIINEYTQSSAEYHTMAFRKAPRAIVLGNTTAGADGNVSEIVLPGGVITMISGIGVYYPDGKETQRVGIIPDVEIKPTINGILNKRDELLEKAIEIINSK